MTWCVLRGIAPGQVVTMWNVRYCLLSLFFFSLQCAEPDTVELNRPPASGRSFTHLRTRSETSSETFQHPAPGSCDDSSPCTTDTCMNGYCLKPRWEKCDDGSICTTDDVCAGSSQCDGGTIVCEASDVPCTTTVCDPVAGCAYIPAPDGAPTDGNKCTGSGECASGECVSFLSIAEKRCALRHQHGLQRTHRAMR